ncbi:hypothetical protein BDW74DRAFT_176203 [Aspergillus multicolor]|uniref:uncharacterized protein n=1 Tax=Aspergillus multicolor TaxID=41759 RepID=UPI003CCDEDCA
MSHAIMDAQSIQTLLRDLCRIYEGHEDLLILPAYPDVISYQQETRTDAPVKREADQLPIAQPAIFPATASHGAPKSLNTVCSQFNISHLVGVCAACDVTPANVCQTACALVLRTYTASENICFANVMPGRIDPLDEVENAVGAFAYSVILRLDVSGQRRIAEVLKQARDGSVDGLARPVARVAVKTFDRVVNIMTDGDAIDLAIYFWESRLDQNTVETVASAFHHALISLGWDGNLTYQEVDDIADKLAVYLVRAGVRPEANVDLLFYKSKWALISQLAVLKAGGCIVPLGVDWPARRLQVILDDTAPVLILTSTKLVDRLCSATTMVSVVNEGLISTVSEPKSCPRVATPKNAAVIIYTSGSTGTPKGAVLSHSALCSTLSLCVDRLGMDFHTRTVQFSAYTFDVSIFDVYSTWFAGGCVCIIPEPGNFTNLASTMEAYRVNNAKLTPTVARLLTPSEVPGLKTLALGGEPVHRSVTEPWYGYVRLFNSCGPSECCIMAIAGELTPAIEPCTLGKAMAGSLWVVEALD